MAELNRRLSVMWWQAHPEAELERLIAQQQNDMKYGNRVWSDGLTRPDGWGYEPRVRSKGDPWEHVSTHEY